MNTEKKRTGKCTVIAVQNQKGGVLKTTTALAIAAGLTEQGNKVLLVDYDPQGSATAHLGFGIDDTDEGDLTVESLLNDEIEYYGITDILNDNMTMSPQNGWHETVVVTKEGFDFIPSSIDLATVEANMMISGTLREYILKRALSIIRPEYDYIILDCAPTLSLLFTNAVSAADKIIIPVAPEKSALRGFKLLFKKIYETRAFLNPELEIAGVLLTKVDARSNMIKNNVERIRKLSSVVHVFPDAVPYGLKDAETSVERNISLIGLYNETKHPSELLTRIATAYRNMVEEVID